MIDLKPLKDQLEGKPIAIFGLAKSGIATFHACEKAGIDTVLWDDNMANVDKMRAEGAAVEDLSKVDLSRFSLLCMAPGVPLTHPAPHPIVVQAQKAGIEIVSDIELFYRAHKNIRTIGITGSNGKSTTTALIGHVLKEAGFESAVGGNIGDAMLSVEQLSDNGIYVLELSSFQLDLCIQYAPTVAAFINISPDHLDRHGSLEGYIKAKERIFNGKGITVIGVDDAHSIHIAEKVEKKGNREVVKVSLNDKLPVDMKECKALQGDHNKQNAVIAFAACKAIGVKEEDIIKAFKTFPGLAHRQKFVANINGVDYINDSKATNDDAAAVALKTFKNIYWIAGGKSKNAGYNECAKYFGNIRKAFLIGKAAEEIADTLKHHNVPYSMSDTIDIAIEEAKKAAEADGVKGVVLLSPACASFDQFNSFEHRGDVFSELVLKLKK